MSTDPVPTVWVAQWQDGDEHPEDCEPLYALFDTREAAVASCPPHGKVREVPVRQEPLAMPKKSPQINWHASWTEACPSNDRCDCGEPHIITSWLETYEDALEWCPPGSQLVPVEVWEVACPDHGYLGKGPIGTMGACYRCHRLVGHDGNRFGRYDMTADGKVSYSMEPRSGLDEGPL